MKQQIEQEQAQLEFGDILGIGMTLVVTVIGLSMGADVTGDIRDDQITNTAGCNSTDVSACGVDYNVTTYGLTGLNKLAIKIPTLVTVMVIAIIIGVLIRHLYVKYSS